MRSGNRSAAGRWIRGANTGDPIVLALRLDLTDIGEITRYWRYPMGFSSLRSSPRRQRGLALLMAMLIVVIGTTVAVSIVHEEKFTIRKSAHIHSWTAPRCTPSGSRTGRGST